MQGSLLAVAKHAGVWFALKHMPRLGGQHQRGGDSVEGSLPDADQTDARTRLPQPVNDNWALDGLRGPSMSTLRSSVWSGARIATAV